MSATASPDPTSRRSQRVALVLLGTAGVVGLATIWNSAHQASEDADATTAPVPAPTPIAADREYANNEYIPGVGYYHAPYHAWFPRPFNSYEAGHGYYAGGFWQAVPWVLALSRSQPSRDAVAAAAAAQRAREDQQRSPARSGFSSGGGHASGFSSGRPASAPAARPSIIRGGFGSSGHPSGS